MFLFVVAHQLKILIYHQGETRDDRLREYHALRNIETVVALREGAMLRVTDDHWSASLILELTGNRLICERRVRCPKERKAAGQKQKI